MNSKKAALLVNTLLKRTEEHRLKWTPAFDDSTAFETAFTNRTIRIKQTWNEEAKFHQHHLQIVDEIGQIIDTIWAYEIRNDLDDAREILGTIYTLARDQALGLDETVDQLLAEMGGPVPPEPEIPF